MSYKDDLERLKNRTEKVNLFTASGVTDQKKVSNPKIGEGKLYVDLDRIKRRNKVKKRGKKR